MSHQKEKVTFSKISKTSSVILLEGKDQKMEALNNDKIKLIGVTDKKVTPPGPNTGGGNRTSTKQILLDFIKEQRQVNKEQRQFNKIILNRLDKLDSRIDNLVKKNNLKE